MNLEEVTRELTQETTCPLNNMKIGEINSKYIDFLRNAEFVETYGLIDILNNAEYEGIQETYRLLNNALFDSELLTKMYPNELDREIQCDEILEPVEDILGNYEKSLEDPEFDVDPDFNAYNAQQQAILDENRITVLVPDGDGGYIEKFIDKRILEGIIKF